MSETLDNYYDQLIEEVETNCDNLSEASYATVVAYYLKLHRNRSLRAFYRYNWIRRVEPLLWAIEQLPAGFAPRRLLDAGCGVGTESLLVGAHCEEMSVLGVDITAERLAAAQERLAVRSEGLKRPLDVSFCNENVFSVLDSQQFSVIWTMEALSHIDPAEHFLEAAASSVPAGGYLVISDSHLTNPAMLWRLYKMRGFRPAERTTRTLSDDEIVSYADERLFSVPRLKGMLKASGWEPVRTQLSIFFPPRLAKNATTFELATGIDRFLNRVPGLRNLGGIYTVVAQRT